MLLGLDGQPPWERSPCKVSPVPSCNLNHWQTYTRLPPTMKQWRHGIAVDCGLDWSWDVIEAAVKQGPHPTARTTDAYDLFAEDIAYQVTAGFSKVVLWDDIKQLRPRNLKISPVALIPQTGRRGRIILDLSFPVYQDVNGVVTTTQQSVNSTTVLTALTEPVKEIGLLLLRLLHYMPDTPRGLHILSCKLDISDGFWRLVSTLCDNTPTVSWVDRMASKAKKPTAGRLLCGLAIMFHYNEAGRLTTVHMPGTDNILADIASRPAKAQNLFAAPTPLSDNAFCTAFDSHFPLPDNLQLTLAVVPPWLRSNVCGALRGS